MTLDYKDQAEKMRELAASPLADRLVVRAVVFISVSWTLCLCSLAYNFWR